MWRAQGLRQTDRRGPAFVLTIFQGIAITTSAVPERFSGLPERRAKRRSIQAQSAATARPMARICNDEWASFGVMSGHQRKTLRRSVLSFPGYSAPRADVQMHAPSKIGTSVQSGSTASCTASRRELRVTPGDWP